MTGENKNLIAPHLFRGDLNDEELIKWLNKLIVALEKPKELEEAAEVHRQSLASIAESISICDGVLRQSICNEAQDPIQSL